MKNKVLKGKEIVLLMADDKAPKKIKDIETNKEYKYEKERFSYETEEEILRITSRLNDEFEIIEDSKVWKPKDDEEYHYISDDGNIITMKWKNIIIDRLRYEVGNCYKIFEEAGKTREKIKIYTQLKRYAEEHNTEKINWRNENQEKWYIYFEKYENEFNTFCCCSCYKDLGQIYFTNEELCWEAIKEIGEDNIKKLFEEE